jgi:hypothetical protein
MKIDWVAAGFAAMRDCGEDISIVYGQNNGSSAQAEPQWFELAHDKFDGIGGLAHLLREQGVRVDKPPGLRGDRLTWSRAIRGFFAVLPALKIRQQQWRRFDAARKAGLRPVRDRVAWQLLTEEQTAQVVVAAKAAGVTVNTFLLFHLDAAVSAQLTLPSSNRLWMIPVNLRGAVTRPDNFLQMSFLAVDFDRDLSLSQLHAQIIGLQARACHWGSWMALHLGKLIGAAGLRRELRNRDKKNNGWTGIFSNLGAWDVPGSGSWIFCPPISRVHPVGAGCVTMNGRMALTTQLHDALGGDPQTSQALLAAWLQPYLQEPARDESVPNTGAYRHRYAV